ncbi:pentapeptide repeat-containing protein [Anabaena sp. WFMT]|uniref:pentapeptide repeat-containing protein n=1 Tax=Anabaena sp. WFMT TaxID=3449730 RepID=UPI003F299F88
MSNDNINDIKRNWLIAAVVLILAIPILVTSYSIFMILTTNRTEFVVKEKYEYIIEILKTAGLFIGGIAVFINIFFAAKRAAAMEETAKAANESAKAANKNAEIAQDKQITERFAKAIEQLASDKPEVILGGIYTLERIARDSAPDQWTIMEVLTAFVRQNAPFIEENESQSPEDQEKFQKLRISIQACLTVIAERKHPDLENKYLDLTRVNISKFNLSGFNLTGAVLTGAVLTEAYLIEADLTGAVLTGAVLTEAYLTEAYLTEAYLIEADLTRADLTKAVLTGAVLFRANLTEAHLYEADLTGANLTLADLTGANLTGANLTGANLIEANLTGADLTRAKLTEADLEGAYLKGATMPDGSIHD